MQLTELISDLLDGKTLVSDSTGVKLFIVPSFYCRREKENDTTVEYSILDEDFSVSDWKVK